VLTINPSDYFITEESEIVISPWNLCCIRKLNKHRAGRYRVQIQCIYNLSISFCPCSIFLHFPILWTKYHSTSIKILSFCWKHSLRSSIPIPQDGDERVQHVEDHGVPWCPEVMAPLLVEWETAELRYSPKPVPQNKQITERWESQLEKALFPAYGWNSPNRGRNSNMWINDLWDCNTSKDIKNNMDWHLLQ
jgi:hypothetical protein